MFHCVNLPRNCWRRIYHWPKQRNSRSYEHNMRLCSPAGWTLPLVHPGIGISWRGSENVWKNIWKDTITNETWCNIMILTLSSFRWYRYAFRTFACISSKIRNTFVYDKQNSSFTSMPNMYCSLEKRTSIPKIKCELRCSSRLKVNLFIKQGREN